MKSKVLLKHKDFFLRTFNLLKSSLNSQFHYSQKKAKHVYKRLL